MNIVLCGAGQVGSHAAEQLAGMGNSITIIDKDPERIRKLEDTLDVRTLCGNCAAAATLLEAGCDDADLAVAATENDEINLFTAAVAKGVGAKRAIARVHHSTYFEQRGLDYKAHFGIDSLICPEYSTAQAIVQTLRNPGALAIENFARGRIEMHEFAVSETASAVGIALTELGLPPGTRLAAITRGGDMFIPDGTSVIQAGDVVVLVGNSNVFDRARKLFRDQVPKRQRVVIMGGPPMAVWLCRALKERDFSIRLFETNRQRAEELAEKLDWVTVLQANPTDPSVFDDEKIDQADAFVGLLDDDEHNILGCAWAKSRGIPQAIAVVQRADYLHLMKSVGIDRPFSPRQVAVTEIKRFLDTSPLRRFATLATGFVDVFWVRVGEKGRVVNKSLREVKLTPDWVIAAIQHGQTVGVPGADDIIHAGDTVLVIGRAGADARLRKIFGAV